MTLRRLITAGAIAGAIASASAASGCVHAPPTGAVPPARHTVPTEDGWHLALHRMPVPEGAPARTRPVILCHGLASNRHSLDLAAGASLARHLAGAGFDVWMLDLRGHGDSREPPDDRPHARAKARRNFDDYVRRDLPAAIEYVRTRTGAEGVAWVGHSMGGMVAYAYLGTFDEDPGEDDRDGIDVLVTIASPGSLKRTGLLRVIGKLTGFTQLFPQVYLRPFGRAHAAVFGGFAPFHLDNLVYNRENLTARERQLLAGTGLENLSRGEVRQFRRWMKQDAFASVDRRDDYAGALGGIDEPALLLSGTADVIVPPSSVQFVMARLGSPDKTHRILGRSEGDPRDWGHVDIAAGHLAATEVFPLIVEWLAARDCNSSPVLDSWPRIPHAPRPSIPPPCQTPDVRTPPSP